MRCRLPILPLLLLAAGCSGEKPESNDSGSATPVIPEARLASATIEPSGYSTILYAEPAALDQPLPDEPGPPGTSTGNDVEAIRSARDASGYLHIFPRMEENAGPVPLVPRYGTLQLRDGCLRVKRNSTSAAPAESVEEMPLAVFSPGMRVFVDEEGYLSLGHTDAGFTASPVRVGEELVFSPAPEVEDEELIAEIREACGEGPLLWVNSPGSFYRRSLAEAARNYGAAARIRGVSVEVAREKMLEQLRESEAARKTCTLSPKDCQPRMENLGKSWLLVWPPPPPPLQ